MILNHLKFAFRHLLRRRGFSALNVGGLALGMTCCLMIGLYVTHELQYDRYHERADRLVRVHFKLRQNENVYHEASVPFPAGPALEEAFPAVVKTARLYRYDEPPIVEVDQRRFAESRFYFADPDLLDLFTIHLISGDARALSDPSNLFISEAMALKYFGPQDPLGRMIRFNGTSSFTVAGVFQNTPTASHVHFDFIAPLQFQFNLWESQTGQEGSEKKWFWTGAWTYALLDDRDHMGAVESGLKEFVLRHFPERTRNDVELGLQSISDIRLHSQLINEIEPTANIAYITLFSAVALAVLIIACINFVNLSTAEASNRVRELGIRRLVGAHQGQLIAQALCESILSSILAAAVTVGLFESSAMVFEYVVGEKLVLSIWNVRTLSIVIAGSLVVGLVSGLYPALLLARTRPLAMVRKSERFVPGGDTFRSVLVGAQFTVSIILLVAMAVIYRQLDFFQHRNMGFNKDQVIVVKAQPEVDKKWDAFKESIGRIPGVSSVSRMSNVPGESAFVYRFVPEGGSMERPASLPLLLVDDGFIDAMELTMAEGRAMSREYPSDRETAFWINEQAAREFGWSGHAVGRRMALFAPGRNEIGKEGHVVGVIRDFHFESLHHEIRPLVVTLHSTDMPYYAIRLENGSGSGTIAQVESVWSSFSPENPIEWNFLDGRLRSLYDGERRVSTMVRAFAVLAVVVSCLGLYGLSMHTAERRTKEIGIRKTLGASGRQIFLLLSSGFMKPLAAAHLVAWPAAYVASTMWLDQFAFRISVGAFDLLIGSAAALLVALGTVAHRTLGAAISNPVEALKYE